jgi:hypothetical protein
LKAQVPVPSDRRAYALHLTEAGCRLRSRLRPLVLAAQDRVLEPLTEKERQLFLDLLTRVVEGNAALVRPGHGRRRPARAASRPDPVVADSNQRAALPGTRRTRP